MEYSQEVNSLSISSWLYDTCNAGEKYYPCGAGHQKRLIDIQISHIKQCHK